MPGIEVPQGDLPSHLAAGAGAVPASDLPDHLGQGISTSSAVSPPPPKENPVFGPKGFNRPLRNPLRDMGAMAYGAATSLYGAPGDLSAGSLGPTTEEVRSKTPNALTPGPDEAGYQAAGDLAPLVAGGAGLVKAGIGAAGRGIGKLGEIASDVASGLKPKSLMESVGKPSSLSDVGEGIQKKVEGYLGKLVETRRGKAQKLADAYHKMGGAKQEQILNDYKHSLADYYAKGVANGSLSKEQAAAVERAANRLSARPEELGARPAQAPEVDPARKFPPKGNQTPPGPATVDPGMGFLEKERRFWNGIADGKPMEGPDAIPAFAARDISKLLTTAIKKHAGKEYDAFIKGYQELSEPINRFNTLLGGKATKEAGEYLPEITKTDPASLPAAFFKSRRSVQELKDLTGDPKFAEQAAREHVATQLAGADTAEAINKYVSKNADWLQEFPEIRSQLQDAAKKVGKGQMAKKAAIGAGALVGADSFYRFAFGRHP